ncbi:hypothetical protein LWI29_036705 [Acer saccharum]|uniref:YqgF/RNase H-like domain-containing protein n=1 Tax=Acer saccharum TaxID=4024 RepID=A0AA39SRD5_ACESA|nr:hypothetical protein LWI29_036705 [Acer saccharum]
MYSLKDGVPEPREFLQGNFKDILIKRDYLKPGRLLGLDFSDKYVSLAVSDWKNLTAVPLRALDRQEINMSSMADMIQSLISEYNLVGFVVGSKNVRPMVSLYVMIVQDYLLFALGRDYVIFFLFD